MGRQFWSRDASDNRHKNHDLGATILPNAAPVTTIAGGLSWPSKKSRRPFLSGAVSGRRFGLRLLAVTADLFLLYSYAAVMAPARKPDERHCAGLQSGRLTLVSVRRVRLFFRGSLSGQSACSPRFPAD
jgi:hypothetical protein